MICVHQRALAFGPPSPMRGRGYKSTRKYNLNKIMPAIYFCNLFGVCLIQNQANRQYEGRYKKKHASTWVMAAWLHFETNHHLVKSQHRFMKLPIYQRLVVLVESAVWPTKTLIIGYLLVFFSSWWKAIGIRMRGGVGFWFCIVSSAAVWGNKSVGKFAFRYDVQINSGVL